MLSTSRMSKVLTKSQNLICEAILQLKGTSNNLFYVSRDLARVLSTRMLAFYNLVEI